MTDGGLREDRVERHAADTPCTITGKRPTAAALQLEREYMDWCATLPLPARDDEVHDDSWAAFMAARHKRMEDERLERRNEQEKLARRARGLSRKPPGQPPMAPGPRVIGRPVDRNSKRQQLLAERAQRRETMELRRQQRAEQLAQNSSVMVQHPRSREPPAEMAADVSVQWVH